MKLTAPDFTKTTLWRRTDKNHSPLIAPLSIVLKVGFKFMEKSMVGEENPRTVYWLGNNLYLNITNRCSNNCVFCIKNFRKGVGGFNLKLSEEPAVAQVIAELEGVMNTKNWAELVFCGFGEPTERLDCLLEVTRWIRRHYGKPLSVRVNTDGHGYVLNRNRDVAKELKAAGVDKVSVSLNASDEKAYEEVCRPKFDNAYGVVLEFIAKAKEELEVEITAVTMPEVDLQKIVAIAEEMKVKFRLRDYIPCFW
ncbi:TatD family nuclease-associated radical SAM protein [Candidatus Bathyarchaeota archaeon]|nr:TatD family nuclease-associated radical SAM protein [Candidatus Bathyarchaeota archaeon]